MRGVYYRPQNVKGHFNGVADALLIRWRGLSQHGAVEAETVSDHHVYLSLAVLLPDTLVGGQPGEGRLQGWQVVAGGQADKEQLP